MAASLRRLTKYLFFGLTPSVFRKEVSDAANRAVFSQKKKLYIRMLSGAGVFGASVSLVVFGHQLRMPMVYAASVDSDQKRPSRREMANFIADVVEKTAPAVVYIEIQGRHPFTGQKMTVSNGSGFIVRADGLILTNAHVVANKNSVKVKLSDGRIVDGSVQAVDRLSDLATVKINQTGLPVLPLGNSVSVRPGEWVIAMGSPFQLNNTVTAGIVSSRARGGQELGMTSSDIEYIQTDANINFGNSGGPLINLDGEAIGINTLKVTTGISFAIPSDYAKEFLQKAEQLERRKTSSGWFSKSSVAKQQAPVKRYMGISMLTLTPSIIQELKMRHGAKFADVDAGVLVHRVTVGSPAHDCGILPGDVIVSINGKPVKASTDVFEALSSSSELRIVFLRGQKRLSGTVIAEEVDS